MTLHRTALGALLLLAALLLASPAAAQQAAPQPARQAVEMLLLPYDTFPTAEDFKKVTADPRAVLMTIVQDPATGALVRLQALDALSLFPDASVRALYRRILAKPRGDDAPAEVHRAINGLMVGFGADALAEVLPLLKDKDVQIRLTVVNAVASRGGQEGRAALRQHLDAEKNNVVREEIARLAAELR